MPHLPRVRVGSLEGYDPPPLPAAPVDPARTDLYSPEELYDAVLAGGGYEASLDGRAYAWSRQPRSPGESLVRALHDHAMDEALARFVADRRIVGVMGGHALRRGEQGYADAARLGHALGGGGHVVATGGGPGAMEAANLGAWLARHDSGTLDKALTTLAGVPTYEPSVGGWAQVALGLRAEVGDGAESLGIPTWHYGHEPPNVFASAIAKYFRNATREAILLEVCDAGIVFLPGEAGTVQEVFQDACENYYARGRAVAPMVLVGRRHWTDELPVWPLLGRLAHGRAMADHVHLVDTVDEAAALID